MGGAESRSEERRLAQVPPDLVQRLGRVDKLAEAAQLAYLISVRASQRP
jgi:hypothetical protein